MIESLSRRSFLAAAAVASVVPAIAPLKAASEDPDDFRPITPIEYLAEMEAHGWRPITRSFGGNLSGGVWAYCLNTPFTWDDRRFFDDITKRAYASTEAHDVERYLHDQGRTVPPENSDAPYFLTAL